MTNFYLNPSIQQYSHLDLIAKQVVEGFITGLHKSPFHGFSVEFAAATTVLLASKMGLPVSTTHAAVGGVLGVGRAHVVDDALEFLGVG